MSVETLALWLFWGSVAFVAYTYFGFPVLLAVRGLFRRRGVERQDAMPRVAVVIAAHNEAKVIREKLDNTFASDYPRELLSVVVASDGSDDGTDDIVRAYSGGDVKLVTCQRQGKNLTLNAGVEAVEDEEAILLFTDADTTLEPQAVRRLVAPFADPEVGGVGGDFHYVDPEKKGSGERAYWSFDRWLKSTQSRAGSMTSATGQIYALRRNLFRPCPVGCTDDFFISTNAVAGHKRLIFEPRAQGSGTVADSADELTRKLRVSAAGFMSVYYRRALLNPFSYGFYAIQLFTHKVMRRVIALPLVVLFVTAPLLWSTHWLYQIATLGQIALHGAALAAIPLRGTPLGRMKIFSIPFYFDMVNLSTMLALVNLVRGRTYDRWKPKR